MYRLMWLYYLPFWLYYVVGFYKKYKILKALFKDMEFKKALEQFKQKTNKEIRQDWLGRLYTVVNVPSEIFANDALTSTFIMDVVKDIDELLRPFDITEIVTLETTPYSDSDSSYYLLVIDYNINPINKFEIFLVLLSIITTISLIVLL